MKRIVSRELPSGEIRAVRPFHITMKGLKQTILCRDNEDYGVMVKYIAVCAHRKNVIVIIYAVVSNHCHVAILAADYQDAIRFADEIKRNYAQWFQTKYFEKQILKNTDVQAISLDSEWYVRNALAYIPRNALDNGESVGTYKWSGYRAMFTPSSKKTEGLPVCTFTRREQDRVMHTREPLKKTHWLVDSEGDLIPSTFCDVAYLEQVFNHDQVFWLKTIGSLNPAEMEEKLVHAPRTLLPDSEFYKVVTDIVQRWYGPESGHNQPVSGPAKLAREKKIRLLPYLWRTRKTTFRQLARVLNLDLESVKTALHQDTKLRQALGLGPDPTTPPGPGPTTPPGPGPA